MQSRFLKILLSVAVLTVAPNVANAQFAAMNAIRINVNMGALRNSFSKTPVSPMMIRKCHSHAFQL